MVWLIKKQETIINISFISGKIPTPRSAIYTATKYAIFDYSNILCQETKKAGIQVLTVNPVPIETNFLISLILIEII